MESSRQQNVLQNLEIRLAQIRSALAELTDIQSQLHRNASESKSAIQSSFSRQLETLRSREVHLLTQVDTLLHIKQERVNLQAEGLQKELGALEALVEQARSDGRGVALKEVEDIMKRFQQHQLVPDEDGALEFEGDTKKLKKAIMSYGSVYPKRQRRDKEGVMGPFEQYAGCQVWLSKTPKSSSGTKDDTPSVVFPIFLEKGDPAVWLMRDPKDAFAMVTSDSEKSDDDDQDSFVWVPKDSHDHTKVFAAHFATILNSPNIHWIRPASKTATVGVSRHQTSKPYSYYRPSSNPKDWLRKPAAQEEQAMDTQPSSPACSPSQTPAKPIEIEDLANLACVQDSPSGAPNPCAPKTSDIPLKQNQEEKPTPCCSSSTPKPVSAKAAAIDIDQVCKGNEKCKTFEECLCDDNCADVAIRRIGFSGVPESSKNQWLIQGQSTESTGESGTAARPKEEMPKDDFAKEWLVSSTSPPESVDEASIVSSLLKWQLEEWEENPAVTKDRSSQKDTDNQRSVNQWLLMKAEESEDMDVDNKKSSEDSKKQSEWLFTRPVHPNIFAYKFPAGDSTSWILKEEHQSDNQGFSPDSKQDVLPEKWLLNQAFGRSAISSRPSGFPYFNVPMDANQWLKQ